MDVLATSPVQAVAFCFQPQTGAFALTVVAKLTFVLLPGSCAVAPEPDDIRATEGYWDDDPRRSLYAPCDLAPLKRRAEVLLVGSAFAPGGRPLRTLRVRLATGEVDKVIEIHGPRLFAVNGELREGSAWTKMPLRYERAAGGPDTWNPVGVWLDGPRDPYGQKHLPNLQPPGVELREPGQLVAPIGFGPISSAWPSRAEKLRGRADLASLLDAHRVPLGEDLDLAYFQDAPADQQLAALRADQSILLENLHPEHERFLTRLPGVKPRVVVELPGEPPADLPVEPDTLWIDTDRARCTLTFRGHRPIADPTVRGRVLASLAERDARASVPPAKKEKGPPGPGDRPPPAISDVAQEITAVQSPTRSGASAPLPFSASAPSSPQIRSSPPSEIPRPRPGRSATEEIVVTPEAMPGLAGPAWLTSPGSPPAPPPLPAPPPPRLQPVFNLPPPPPPASIGQTLLGVGPAAPLPAPPAPGVVAEPPPVEMLTRAPAVAPVSLADASAAALSGSPPQAAPFSQEAVLPPPVPAMSPPAVSPPAIGGPGTLGISLTATSSGASGGSVTQGGSGTIGSVMAGQGVLGGSGSAAAAPAPPRRAADAPGPPGLGGAEPRALSAAAAGGVLAASNAAAGTKGPVRPAAPERADAAKPDGAEYLELLWYDRAIASRLRAHPVFKAWVKPPPKAPPPQQGKPPPPPPSPEAVEKAERADVHNVLSKDPAAAAGSTDPGEDGEEADPPIALLSGALSFPFEEVETLKVVMAVAKPLAPADKRLKELLDLAAELLKSDMDAEEAAPGLTAKIREAWARANRSHPAGYLDARVEQKLLEARKYQKRSVLEDEWIRALLTLPSGEVVAAYVPVKLATRLPLYARFNVKMLAELYPQQDPEEVSQAALKVKALARVAERPRLSKPVAPDKGAA